MNLLRSASLLALASIGLVASAQNLVQDPDFESATARLYSPGESIDGFWTVGNPPSGNPGETYVDDDSHAIQGKSVFLFGSALTQSLDTTVGQAYVVSFDAYGYQGFGPNVDGGDFVVAFGSQSFSLTAPNDRVFRFTVSGVATSSSTLLSFATTRPNAIELDNVSVTPQAVPEPATLAALGLGAVAVLRRRKNRA